MKQLSHDVKIINKNDKTVLSEHFESSIMTLKNDTANRIVRQKGGTREWKYVIAVIQRM